MLPPDQLPRSGQVQSVITAQLWTELTRALLGSSLSPQPTPLSGSEGDSEGPAWQGVHPLLPGAS